MYRNALLTVLIFIVVGVFADNYRVFTSADGEKIYGRIVAYDVSSKMVQIERENKKICKVPVNIFSESDQRYIDEWGKIRDFLNASKFKITAKRLSEENSEYTVESSGSRTDAENITYEIFLNNRTESAVEIDEIEYCVFYEQDVGKSKNLEGVLFGSMTAQMVLPRATVVVSTEPVVIFKKDVSSNLRYFSGAGNRWDGDVKGIWLRAHLTLSSGEKITRTLMLPDSIGNSRTWMTSSRPVGFNN